MNIPFNSEKIFFEIASLQQDHELKNAVNTCIKKLREVVLNEQDKIKPNPNGKHEVTEQALNEILRCNEDVSDIRTKTDLSNVLVFHTIKLDGSVVDDEVMRIRQEVDDIVSQRIKDLFADELNLDVKCSGHFLYPEHGFMGWHTNSRKPGWRLYITHTEHPGNSFFRYKDPDNGEIVTCNDNDWDFRIFNIVPEKPLWHCVYTECNRWSLGYTITQKDT